MPVEFVKNFLKEFLHEKVLKKSLAETAEDIPKTLSKFLEQQDFFEETVKLFLKKSSVKSLQKSC